MPLLGLYRNWRRKRVRAQPFPAAWDEILERNVPLIARLPDDKHDELRGHVLVLLDEKHFEGCGGLELTDEIRVTIAGHAALLMLRPSHEDVYPGLRSILVYPETYRAPREHFAQSHQGGLVPEGDLHVEGQSWSGGTLVLAWSTSRSGALNPHDGSNVILHEFAHQLDTQDGAADGAPLLDGRSDYTAWAAACRPEFEKLVSTPHKSVLDRYGATNPAEFFAVATEAYFEKPRQLRKRHRELYDVLDDFYGLGLADVT